MAGKSKERACSYCHQVGHNARTCVKKKAEGGASASAKVKDESSSAKPAAAISPVPAAATPPNVSKKAEAPALESPSLPGEYQGGYRVVPCSNGATIRMDVREYEGTPPNYTLRIQRSAADVSELQFDHETACRIIEQITWAVQRQTARQGLSSGRPNGSKSVRTEAG
jgi:hypothetical protein